ncbi:MAG: alpha/beta hydrolase [Eubacterium sp.]|jgi:alpha-beta hydrolase superfamily lysophospholipase|nr:alpha/beta hydrolase [Eubacterium sp.]
MQENFEFLSADGKTKIHAVKWMPDTGRYTAILQITHGMQEYIERYREFAEYLTAKGVFVVGHDHLGHGESVSDPREYGFFREKHPSDALISDMHTLRKLIQKEDSDTPYFMLGHSMGSYMLRKYITLHHRNLHGAVIVGAGCMPDAVMKLGMMICRFLGRRRGWHYRSPLVKKMSFMGPYQKYDVTGQKIENNWLTKDLKIARKYYKDPKCRFDFTVNGYYGLMEAVWYDNQKKHIERIPKDFPLLLLSGDKDPVGDMGKGVRKSFHQYQQAGLTDVSLKLYKNDRHELLNETDRKDVYEDIFTWISKKITIYG